MLAISLKLVCDVGHNFIGDSTQRLVTLALARIPLSCIARAADGLRNVAVHFSGRSMLPEFFGNPLIGDPSRGYSKCTSGEIRYHTL